jgi:ribosomal protein S19
MCHTTVTIEGETLEMWLPVMDGANKSMKKQAYTYNTRFGDKSVEAATTFDINKTIMRCLVKNLAMFGLGIYIYAGEDIPEAENTSQRVSAEPVAEAEKEVLKKGTENWDKVSKYVKDNNTLGIQKIVQQLSRKYTITPVIRKELGSLLNEQ